MTTATLTWPTADELRHVEQRMADASNALDEIQLAYWRLGNDVDLLDDGTRLPTFEELGRVSRFIACIEQDLDVIREHLQVIREAHNAAAVRMADDAR